MFFSSILESTDAPDVKPQKKGKGKTPSRAGPAHQQKDVFVRPKKLCTSNTGATGRLCQHKDVEGSATSRSLLLRRCSLKYFPRVHTGIFQVDFDFTLDSSRHCISRNAFQCAPTIDVISYEHRLLRTTGEDHFKAHSLDPSWANSVSTFTNQPGRSAVELWRTSMRRLPLALPDFAILHEYITLRES